MTWLLLQIGLFWLLQIALVAANPLAAAFVFAAVIAVVVLVFRWFGWIWTLGLLTLVGLVSGPALLLVPVIGGLSLMKGGTRNPAAETTSVPRPILLEPRVADRSR